MTPFHFDPSAYGPAAAALLGERLMPLGPGTPPPAAHSALRAFDPLTDLGRPVADADAARACHAGLWLYHDGLDESVDVGPVKRHGCPSHGIGLTPDEKELWVADAANQRVHIFDATVMPPRQVASITLRDEPGPTP